MLPTSRLNSLAVDCDPHLRKSVSRPIFHSADLPRTSRFPCFRNYPARHLQIQGLFSFSINKAIRRQDKGALPA